MTSVREFEDGELVAELENLAALGGAGISKETESLLREAAARLAQLTGARPPRAPHQPLTLNAVKEPCDLDFGVHVSVNSVGSRLLIGGDDDLFFLSPESVEKLAAYLKRILPGDNEEEPSKADLRDAARWRALIKSARITSIGSAGLSALCPNHYAHLTVNLWSVHPEASDPQTVKDLKRFVRISARAQKAAAKRAKAPRLYSYRVTFQIHSDLHEDDTDPVCTDTTVVSAPNQHTVKELVRPQLEQHRCWDERIHPWFKILKIERQD